MPCPPDAEIVVSFVFPCLNEAETLPGCLAEARAALALLSVPTEILVADNGSTDASVEIAEAGGSRVIHVSQRGYGAALRGGMNAARGEYVAFADADGSYRIADLGRMWQLAITGKADLVIASRMTGPVDAGAMPILHRFLGTPVLTALINILFGGHLSDCNSGFRLLRKTSFARWDVRSSGMEFASELLIKALKDHAILAELPSGLRQDRRSRLPHLRTWRDGMRHLLFIFSERPQLFEIAGEGLVLITGVVQLAAWLLNVTDIGGVRLFGYHTQALMIPFASLGTQFCMFSCYLYMASREKPGAVTARMLHLGEVELLVLLLSVMLFEVACVGFVFWRWSQAGFAHLDMIRFLLVVIHFMTILGFLSVGLLGIHVFKRLTK